MSVELSRDITRIKGQWLVNIAIYACLYNLPYRDVGKLLTSANQKPWIRSRENERTEI